MFISKTQCNSFINTLIKLQGKHKKKNNTELKIKLKNDCVLYFLCFNLISFCRETRRINNPRTQITTAEKSYGNIFLYEKLFIVYVLCFFVFFYFILQEQSKRIIFICIFVGLITG